MFPGVSQSSDSNEGLDSIPTGSDHNRIKCETTGLRSLLPRFREKEVSTLADWIALSCATNLFVPEHMA